MTNNFMLNSLNFMQDLNKFDEFLGCIKRKIIMRIVFGYLEELRAQISRGCPF